MTLASEIVSMVSDAYDIMGETVTYSRDAGSVELTALPQTSREVAYDLQAGLRIPMSTKTFRLLVSDLIINDAAIEPRSGDTITDAAGISYHYNGHIKTQPGVEWVIDVTEIGEQSP